jgi:hypothetical protein
MINKATVSSYCKDDIRLIENYEKAVADRNAVWHCHHRLELTLDGQYAVSKADLIRMDMYYCRPHFELILLPPTAHNKLHCIDKSHRSEIARKTPHTRNCTIDSEAEFYESIIDETMAEIDSAVEDAIRSGAKPIGIIDLCVCETVCHTH